MKRILTTTALIATLVGCSTLGHTQNQDLEIAIQAGAEARMETQFNATMTALAIEQLIYSQQAPTIREPDSSTIYLQPIYDHIAQIADMLQPMFEQGVYVPTQGSAKTRAQLLSHRTQRLQSANWYSKNLQEAIEDATQYLLRRTERNNLPAIDTI